MFHFSFALEFCQFISSLGVPTLHVLIVEDDRPLADFLSRSLAAEGFGAEILDNGDLAIQRLSEASFDLVLLDLNLPGCDGTEVLRVARERHRSTAILVVSGRSGLQERVRCLDLGADDCLMKPFALSELVARSRALLRRSQTGRESTLSCGDLELNRVERTVRRAGVLIDLTSKEFALAEFLLQHQGQPVSRTELLEQVWKMPATSATNVVDVYINYLRRKIDHGFGGTLIHTVRGAGYHIAEAPSAAVAKPAIVRQRVASVRQLTQVAA
jgi:DNA-binding response OmpR family regulator